MEEQKLVEKYKDIPDTEFVPIECLGDNFDGLYEINKLGQIKTVSTGLIRSNFSENNHGYPIVMFNSKTKAKGKLLHIILAKTFLLNPNNYPIVDHLDRNRSNFQLSNLRWSSYKDNNLNKEKGIIEVIYIKLDDNFNEISRVSSLNLSYLEKASIRTAIQDKRKYKGVYWDRIYPNVENYLKEFGNPKEDEWKDCLRDNYFECHPIGLLRVKKTKRIILGSLHGGYLTVVHQKRCYQAHRLIFETFSGRLLNSDEIVDHINTNSQDNRFINLRAGTQKDNMNNPISKQKISIPILQFSLNGKYLRKFNSKKDAVAYMNLSSIKPSSFKIGYIAENCILCEESVDISLVLNKVIFVYDKDYNFIDSYRTIYSLVRDFKIKNISVSKHETISKYIDTGKLAPDGHYYYHGPHKFTNDEQNKNQDPDNNI